MSPAALDRVLSKLPRQEDPRLLVGFRNKDDAGVYLLNDGLALVQTTDFFTPIVDDPYQFGQIAAANSLSDIYAMGGKPMTALSIVCYPESSDLDVLERILVGGLDKMIEAECTIVGGHMVRDSEVKFGYAVTGTINPSRIWTNSGAKPGDVLLLTKPLGTGVIATAIRAGKAEPAWTKAAISAMRQLNKDAAEALGKLDPLAIHSVTDITGFGFLGHASEMATGSSVSLRIQSDKIELLEGALECSRNGFIAGGLKKNREFIGDCVRFNSVPLGIQNLLFDPQTSGGLFAAVDPKFADEAKFQLELAGCRAMHIGEVIEKTSPLIEVE
jgi:selenide,water dikinase